MPRLQELEAMLAALRAQIARRKPGDYTPLQILQLRRDCQRLWKQIEIYLYESLAGLVSPDLTEAH